MIFNPFLAAQSGVDAIKSMVKSNLPDFEGWSDQYKEYNPKTEWLSLGEGLNEVGDNYSYGEGSHNLRLLKFVSPDIMLVHQSRMVGFYVKIGKGREIPPVGRDIKNLLLKDYRY